MTTPESQSSPAALDALAARLQPAVGTRFEVLRPIAVGGMAVLFQLRHRLHGGIFVAKVLQPQLAERPGVVASFRSEATHAAILSAHPNVVPVYDLSVSEGLFFLIMPYIDGEDLDHLLKRIGPLGRSEALVLAAQMSSVLSFAESKGIAHGDISPGNIRIDQFGQYRVLDFGLSRRQGAALRDMPAGTDAPSPGPALGGTPLYMSPEHVRGEQPDGRSDLYALGLVLLEALLGHHPCTATGIKEVEQWHVHGALELPHSVAADAPLRALLKHLLAKDPEQRFQSAFEVSGVLAAMGCELPEFRSRKRPEGTAAELPATRKRRLLSQ